MNSSHGTYIPACANIIEIPTDLIKDVLQQH